MEDKLTKKIESFFSKGTTLRYKKGDFLIRADDSINFIYYLKNGYVRQYLLTEDGQETTIHIFRPSSFFPIAIVIAKLNNPFNFEALSDIEVKRQSMDKVLEFVRKNQDVMFDLTTRFARGLIGLAQRVENLSFESAKKRLILFLLYLVKRFGIFSKKEPNGITIDLKLTHSHIASWIGTSRETTSKQIEELISLGAVGKNGRFIIVKSIKKLEEELLNL